MTDFRSKGHFKFRATLSEDSHLPSSRFDLKVEHFGPIHNADIKISPLTVFVGPNQSGKSFLAKLIYSLYKSNHDTFISTQPGMFFETGRPSRDYNSELLGSFLKNLPNIPGKISLPSKIIDELKKVALEEYYGTILPKTIQKTFGISLKDFGGVRISYEDFTNKHAAIEISGDSVKLLALPDIKLDPEQFISIKEDEPSIRIGYQNFSSLFRFEQLKDEKAILNMQSVISISVINEIYSQLFFPAILDGVYFPSGRAALMEMRERLTAGLFQAATLDNISLPPLSGIHANFFNLINIILSEQSETPWEFESLIQELINGTIKVEQPVKTVHAIQVNQNGENVPINLLSSGVLELLPILLYIKFRMKKGDFLIIEEPEAHLHPGMQRIMAKLLTKLIRYGVGVVITTHSDFLLSQLSNHVVLSRHSSARREEIAGDSNLFLTSKEVGIYSIIKNEFGTYETESVLVNEDNGISSEEFLKITESLYDEIVQIHRDDNQ